MTWLERAVEYAGNLDCAAHEVVAELDETDGVVVGTQEYKDLIRQVAKTNGVGRKDLHARVLEFLE